MGITEALEQVGKLYIPGVVAYYEKLNPDPWMEEHEKLNKIVMQCDPELTEVACERFVRRCSELIERFKRESTVPGRVSRKDAFAIGDESRVRQWQSRKGRYCFYCDSTENLTLESDGMDALDVRILCRACKENRNRRRA